MGTVAAVRYRTSSYNSVVHAQPSEVAHTTRQGERGPSASNLCLRSWTRSCKAAAPPWAIVSMFVGGMTTGRMAGILTRGDGMVHGVVMWGVSLLLALYLGSVGVGRVLGGVTGFVSQTTSQAVGGAVSGAGAAGGAAAAQGGVNVSEGQQQAQQAAQDAQQQVQQQAGQVRQQAGEVAGDAANVAAKGAWGALLLMGLSVAAAAFGAGMKARE